jgi:perosamine synthetase
MNKEQALKPWTGSEYVIATNSGTAALHLANLVLDIRYKKIVTQALTFIATANAIFYCCNVPHFCDVNNQQFLDYNKIDISDFGAIIPVHLNRNVGDVSVFKQFNVPIIEDACQALGIWKLQGDIGCLSFNGNKIITTGGGGAFCTNRKDLYDKAAKIVNIGREQGSYYHDSIGYNYRMPSYNALRGLQELEKLPDYLKNKKPKERNMYTPLTEFTPYDYALKEDLTNTYRIWKEEKALYFEND